MTFNLDPDALTRAGRTAEDRAADLRDAGALTRFGPTGVDDAAETLRSVAHAARRAADFLDGQGALPREDFGGLAARRYRDASAALGADSRGVADDTHGLAVVLDDYAAGIAAVRQMLADVREDALAQGFTITPEERVESVPVPGTTVNLPFQRLDARAIRAHLPEPPPTPCPTAVEGVLR